MTNARIFLIGRMGAGKTSIGRKLAGLLQLDFLDSDHVIEHELQQSIADIIRNFGEQYFRTQERRILANISLRPNLVLATGGGSVLAQQTREDLQSRGLVCYLKVSPARQMQRLQSDLSRPLLPNGAERMAYFCKMSLERDYLYQAIADIILDTDNAAVDTLTRQLAIMIREYAYS